MKKRTRLNRIQIGLLIAVFVLLLPIALPLALIIIWIHHRRSFNALRVSAKATLCTKCGNILGSESLRLADAEWKKHVRTLMAKYPFVRFRIARTLHAICSHCGARYTYFEKTKTFAPEDISASGAWRKKNFTKQDAADF